VATGARHGYFGHQEWAHFAPGLKTIDNAICVGGSCWRSSAPKSSRTRASSVVSSIFVVVGGGPTGVAMASAIAELAKRAGLSVH
jgi:NADH dehydrogenase